MVEWHYLVQLFFFRKKNVKNNSGYCYFWRFLSINSGEDCPANQPFLFILTTSSAWLVQKLLSFRCKLFTL